MCPESLSHLSSPNIVSFNQSFFCLKGVPKCTGPRPDNKVSHSLYIVAQSLTDNYLKKKFSPKESQRVLKGTLPSSKWPSENKLNCSFADSYCLIWLCLNICFTGLLFVSYGFQFCVCKGLGILVCLCLYFLCFCLFC